MEVKPIMSKDAAGVAEFLYELICRHGCANVQINDQGREFYNRVCDKLFELTGTKQRITSAYHRQANGLVERFNRTLQGSMLKLLQDEQKEWPAALNGILFAFRTARQSSTRISPFEMLYGRKAILPVMMHQETNLENEENPVNVNEEELDVNMIEIKEHLSTIQSVQKSVHKTASENIAKAQRKQERDYENRHGGGRYTRSGRRSLFSIFVRKIEKAENQSYRMKVLMLFLRSRKQDCMY